MSSGILVIQNYGVIIFARLGYDNVQVGSMIDSYRKRSLIVTLQQLLFQTGYTANALFWSTVAMSFVDRVPRNRLLGIGYGMCGVFLTLLTILLSQFEDSTNRTAVSEELNVLT